MKRARSNNNASLTGGTGDVNPQYMTASVTQTAADVTTTQEINIPIQRLPDDGRAQVMEVLKVLCDCDTGVETDWGNEISLTTRNHGTTRATLAATDIVAFFTWTHTITTSGATKAPGIVTWDCTDGAGHGVLVATDKMYVQYFSNTTGLSNSATMKILYRWKNVSLAEYIGIVQSQS